MLKFWSTFLLTIFHMKFRKLEKAVAVSCIFFREVLNGVGADGVGVKFPIFQ